MSTVLFRQPFFIATRMGLQSVSPDPGSSFFSNCWSAVESFLTKFFSNHFVIFPQHNTSLKIWWIFLCIIEVRPLTCNNFAK